MEGDIAEMGKFIGAGLATMGLGGAGIGVGRIAGNFIVPPGCDFQWLIVTMVGQETRSEDVPWIDDVAITTMAS